MSTELSFQLSLLRLTSAAAEETKSTTTCSKRKPPVSEPWNCNADELEQLVQKLPRAANR